MSDGSTIEWLAWPGYKSASWNPTRGCTRVSEGCRNCYAEVMAARFNKPGQWGHGLAEMRGGDHRWTGRVELDEAKLLLPLRWRTPRVIFVNSTSDLFHERLPDEAIDKVFAVASLVPRHLLIILTKRAERMRDYTGTRAGNHVTALSEALCKMPLPRNGAMIHRWPLPNVILGVSVEDQATADERIPHLLTTPAACRMVSAEPLLGPVDLTRICILAKRPGSVRAGIHADALAGRYVESGVSYHGDWDISGPPPAADTPPRRIGWVVTGGESGPAARPMHPDWARSIRDQCQDAGVPFFFKQWGEWVGGEVYRVGDRGGFARHQNDCPNKRSNGTNHLDHWWSGNILGGVISTRVGKHRAGRLLDGRTHDEFPDISPKIPA